MAPVQTLDELVARARPLASGPRRILGLSGAPGAGKSTLAAQLVAALEPAAVLVPMDGFHLANAELERLGRRDRKGAPDTFDALGYVALLQRLRQPGPGVVYAPVFDRRLEEALAGALPVPADTPLVVTEGNYLLLDQPPWSLVRPLLDEAWYLEIDDTLRVERLVNRHVAHGKEPAGAREWVLRSDESNARLIAGSRARADLVVSPAL
jgi:pantothenate kinase